ncbi:spore germination protein [Paenibacillus ginsengarvi]|uniref:Spore germination protein n=1 Tax=Paenibacillus ginsengarvi TaxID=400777 RepID=A0A3B0C149_9BACL|nr:spore germination protein [Paenibacillus ginsengarvi]RKN79102.1 spore germination protein [Paenibacillus ginsengarvi]
MKHHKPEVTVWNESKIRELFASSSDVQLDVVRFHERDLASAVMLIYSDGLSDTPMISKTILPELNRIYQQTGFDQVLKGVSVGVLPLLPLGGSAAKTDIVDAVFEGDLVLLFLKTNMLFKISICNRPDRQPEESSTEISIKGPKDGFVENIAINVALIRKRIRSTSLCYETTVLGARTRTKVGLLYFEDIIQPEILAEVRKRLAKIDVDGVYSIGQLEEALADVKYPLFPLLDITGRPDYAVSSLLAGRFVVIVDGNPLVLIGPASLGLILKSPEDIHFNFQYVTFTRLIRLFSFVAAVMLPGLWVALSAFHQDQIPFRLMATISVARMGLPLSAQMEMFLLLVLLEIFREAGVRLPSSIGQTLTVIGGLVIGDAAIRAGLVSPSVVVVGAITAVMGVTLVNQSLSTVVSVIRFGVFLASSIIGMYGLILSSFLLLFYMSKLRSFGVPYLSPLSPPIFGDMLKGYMRLPWILMKNRPKVLNPIDPDHKEDRDSE